MSLLSELENHLAASDSKLRKYWVSQIVAQEIQLSDLIVLLHAELKTAQRFSWLIGDLLEIDRERVRGCFPLLFDLRNEMPFKGMQRTVAKCIWFLGLPSEHRDSVVEQLFEWLDDNQFEVSIKHYASKALFELTVKQDVDLKRLKRVLSKQSKHSNSAHAKRMKKLLARLNEQK